MKTLGVYAKVVKGSHETAIANLPDYSDPHPENAAATGTYGDAGTASATARKTALNGMQNQGLSVHGAAQTGAGNGSGTGAVNPCDDNELSRIKMHAQEHCPKRAYTPPRGLEPLSPA